jgi:hypothetical protein
MEWPTMLAFSSFAASSSRSTQSAISAMVAVGGPSDRPCAGKSSASALRP